MYTLRHRKTILSCHWNDKWWHRDITSEIDATNMRRRKNMVEIGDVDIVVMTAAKEKNWVTFDVQLTVDVACWPSLRANSTLTYLILPFSFLLMIRHTQLFPSPVNWFFRFDFYKTLLSCCGRRFFRTFYSLSVLIQTITERKTTTNHELSSSKWRRRQQRKVKDKKKKRKTERVRTFFVFCLPKRVMSYVNT